MPFLLLAVEAILVRSSHNMDRFAREAPGDERSSDRVFAAGYGNWRRFASRFLSAHHTRGIAGVVQCSPGVLPPPMLPDRSVPVSGEAVE